MNRTLPLIILFVVQAVCAMFFVTDIVMSVFGFYPLPISWTSREVLEIGAAVGLVLGLIFGTLALRRSIKEMRFAQAGLRRASTAFMDVLNEHFAEWGLTPAERDVALFSIKGLSMQDIAAMRQTSEGTIKAQTNAIYRKAGVSGRPQLLSLFIEDLMAEPISQRGKVGPVVAEIKAAE